MRSRHGAVPSRLGNRPRAGGVRWLGLAALVVSCSWLPLPLPLVDPPTAGSSRLFDFSRDTFAFQNDVIHLSPGREGLYSLHCFQLACDCNRFFKFARFDPALPKASDDEYRRLAARVVGTPFYWAPPAERERVVIPGYADLRGFSAAHEDLLKDVMGSPWPWVFSFRNWRMGFGTTPLLQAVTARQMLDRVRQGACDQIHMVDGPFGRALNHSVLAYDALDGNRQIVFLCYDPNETAMPLMLFYDKFQRRFSMVQNRYFRGGPVSVYRIYHSFWR